MNMTSTPEIIGTLAGNNVLLDRESKSVIVNTTHPIRFHVDHPYIQGTLIERVAREALARREASIDRGPCMYDDGIVAADDTCLRCKVKSGEDCKDI